MSNGINTVAISGNITKDAVLSSTPSGTNILEFTLAVNESRKSGDGAYEDYSNFFDVVVYGNRAVALEKYLTKGTFAAIGGKLAYSSWEDKASGKMHSRVRITADSIDFKTKGE